MDVSTPLLQSIGDRERANQTDCRGDSNGKCERTRAGVPGVEGRSRRMVAREDGYYPYITHPFDGEQESKHPADFSKQPDDGVHDDNNNNDEGPRPSGSGGASSATAQWIFWRNYGRQCGYEWKK
ncbi:uncharacterized protein FOMMEDRAFT_157074 [Fomitiporia mediterranea MF3/22]|uniref:uncharacterized protein n=1 Tax=Fomitiporia mediterranea (strain MF3/22) TaxID=694068 RepID=UPI000440925D|nr:uncharacterized protein FOMMEDRAFT_157074 [Fomitiporia mediterranea MF3/22]EJD01933.1 hypothetical protein FOMMEDRAFT_157074 [Fomitiporia mediterranea MF3/22]